MSEPFKGPFRWSVDGNHWRIEDSESLLAAHAYWEKAAQWLCDRLNTLPTNAAGEREEFEREWAKRYPDTNDVREWAPIKAAARVMWQARASLASTSIPAEGVREIAEEIVAWMDKNWRKAGMHRTRDAVAAILSRHAGQQGDWAAGVEAAAKVCDDKCAAYLRDADSLANDTDPELADADRQRMVREMKQRASGVRLAAWDIRNQLLASSPAPQQARPGLTGEERQQIKACELYRGKMLAIDQLLRIIERTTGHAVP
jgi:hypothetical protein